MPLFSDTIEHGSTSVDAKPVEFTAHGRDRGFATRTPRNNHPVDALRRMSNAYGEWVPTSTYSVDVPCEMYGWDVGVTRRRVTVVSRTANQIRENQKEKPLTQLAQEGVSIRR